MDEIRGAEKAMRKAYSYTVTESQRLRNEEVRHLWRSYYNFAALLLPVSRWLREQTPKRSRVGENDALKNKKKNDMLSIFLHILRAYDNPLYSSHSSGGLFYTMSEIFPRLAV
jgi:hypothetical protein